MQELSGRNYTGAHEGQAQETLSGLRDSSPEKEVLPAPKPSAEEAKAWEREYSGEFTLTDNAIGKIKNLTIAYSSNLEWNDERRKHAIFPEDVSVTILVPPQSDIARYRKAYLEALETWGIKTENRVTIVESHRLKGAWTRDVMLTAKNPKTGKDVLIGTAIDRYATRSSKHVAREMAGVLEDTEYGELPMLFEGGDVRAIGPYLFEGKATIEKASKGLARPYNQSYFVLPNGEKRIVGFKELNIARQEVIEEFDIEDWENSGISFHEQDQYQALEIGGEPYPVGGPLTEVVERYKEELSRAFGREVIVVGEDIPEPQPGFHLDLFCTFLPNADKKPTVVIGDIGMTRDILNSLTPEQRAEEVREARSLLAEELRAIRNMTTPPGIRSNSTRPLWKDTYEIGNPMAMDIDGYIKDLNSATTLQEGESSDPARPGWLEKIKETERLLDLYAKWFEEKGFRVDRIPFVPAPTISHKTKKFEPAAPRTYNNGYVEAYVDKEGYLQRNYYMPSYGLKRIGEAAEKVFNSYGYNVKQAAMMHHPLFRGALNCTTLERRIPN